MELSENEKTEAIKIWRDNHYRCYKGKTMYATTNPCETCIVLKCWEKAGKEKNMLYKVRTGDILLCKNEFFDFTNAYLVVYDAQNGFGLWCITCGESVGFYGEDIEKMKQDISNNMNIQAVVPKEEIISYLNDNCKPDFPVRVHEGFHELDLEIECRERD